MADLTFVHAADLHLDSPFHGLRSVDAEIGAALREATFRAFDNIIALCRDRRVDALLVAGDVFDGADRSLRAQLRFRDGMETLAAENIRVFVCHGNHDPLDGWEYHLTLPEGCHRFGPEVEAVPLDPAAPERAAVYGVSYPRQEVHDNLAVRFRRDPAHRFAVGLLHANVGGDTGHAPYAPCSLDNLVAAGMDYWALGHVHTRAVLRDAHPAVVYPGNPQGRHIREAGARGVYHVTVSDDGRVQPEFVPVDVVRWDLADVSIAPLASTEALLAALDAQATAMLDAGGGRPLVCRFRITGRGPLHDAVRRPGVAEDLRAQINDQGMARDPFLWCGQLDLETAPSFDREERRQAQDFLGDVLRLVDELRDGDENAEWLREQVAAFYSHRRTRPFLPADVLSAEELARLLAAAEEHCVEALLDAAVEED